MFGYKNDALGEIVGHKAQLIANGYSQMVGMDFNETFAQVSHQ